MADPLGIAAPIGPFAVIEPHAAPSVTSTPSPPSEGNARGATRALPTELASGTLIEAVVVEPSAGGPVAGTQILLRVVVAADTAPADLVIATVTAAAGNDTMVATPLGLLALHRHLALPPGATIAFTIVETTAPPRAPMGSETGLPEWQEMDETLSTLAASSPRLAEALQAALTPTSPAELAGGVLYFLGTIYHGAWQGGWLAAALARLQTEQPDLARRLGDDLARLKKRSADPATGEWDVFTLPLRFGQAVQPLYLYLSRRKSPDGAKRFALEVELHHFGPVQLDGMLRGDRLILVLRSHHALPAALRAQLKAKFDAALPPAGLSGEFSAATASHFLVEPLAQLRQHVALTI